MGCLSQCTASGSARVEAVTWQRLCRPLTPHSQVHATLPQAAEAERVAKVQQKEAAAEARSAQRLAAAQALIAEKEATRREAEAQRQVIVRSVLILNLHICG